MLKKTSEDIEKITIGVHAGHHKDQEYEGVLIDDKTINWIEKNIKKRGNNSRHRYSRQTSGCKASKRAKLARSQRKSSLENSSKTITRK